MRAFCYKGGRTVTGRARVPGISVFLALGVLGVTIYLGPFVGLVLLGVLSTAGAVVILLNRFLGRDKVSTISVELPIDSKNDQAINPKLLEAIEAFSEPYQSDFSAKQEDFDIGQQTCFPQPPVAGEGFDAHARLIALWELQYLPSCGRCKDEDLRAKAFRNL